MRISDWSSDVCSSDLCGSWSMTDRATVSPPKPESKMPMGRSATVDQSRRSPQQTPHMAIHLTVSALLRASGPALSLEAVLGLVDGAPVSRPEERSGGNGGGRTCRSGGWAQKEK